ncbi:hypothetical protein [Burkholderia cepacia]|uniref:hypothetical protein n=1 Tax=Burkholderia cepacia TaxID=292 RepID=UPI0012D9F971|nr:hypothetical protein [Burkholderia cepacia]
MPDQEVQRIRADAKGRGLRDPVKAFRQQYYSALRRGIAFNLTFSQWWMLWEPHYHLRGVRSGQMVMARNGDSGPYALGNVIIKTARANHREAHGYEDGEISRGLRTFKKMRGSSARVVGSRTIQRFEIDHRYDDDGELIEDDGGPKNILTSSIYDC